MIRPVAFIFAILVLAACVDHELPVQHTATLTDCGTIEIDPGAVDQSTDSYSVKSAIAEQGKLFITLQYGGGCGGASATLKTHGAYMESIPVQLQLILDFKDDDHCKAIIQNEFCFDLTPIAAQYKAAYQTNSGTILLRIPHYDGLVRFVF
jgi:hypothetical protein